MFAAWFGKWGAAEQKEKPLTRAWFDGLELEQLERVRWSYKGRVVVDDLVRVHENHFMLLHTDDLCDFMFRVTGADTLTVEDMPGMTFWRAEVVLARELPRRVPRDMLYQRTANKIRAAVLYFDHVEEFDRIEDLREEAVSRGMPLLEFKTEISEIVENYYRLLGFTTGHGSYGTHVDWRM